MVLLLDSWLQSSMQPVIGDSPMANGVIGRCSIAGSIVLLLSITAALAGKWRCSQSQYLH
jgi:hypothetical protein